jgi:dihydroorotate dehydrogenase
VYTLLRPLLFRLDPETAHRLTLISLARLHRLGLRLPFVPHRIECPLTVMGLRFPNPVGLAAGLDKDGECIDAFGALGFGFVEIGTVTPWPQPGNPPPRLFRLPTVAALINRMGFNNQGVDRLVERLRTVRFEGPIGVNIGKNRDTPVEQAATDYLECLRRVYPWAGYVAVNVSSPNTPQLRRLQASDALPRLLAALKTEQGHLASAHGRTVPLAVKVAPDLLPDELEALAHTLLEEGIEGVIATNTTVAREGVAHLRHGNEAGGLSGAPLAARATAVVQALHSLLGGRIPIIGVGGVLSAADALAKRAAGATLVQLYTGLIYRGPALVAEVAQALCAQESPTSSLLVVVKR